MFGKSDKALYIFFIGGNYTRLNYSPEAYEKLAEFLGDANFEGITHIKNPSIDREVFINWKNVAYTEWY